MNTSKQYIFSKVEEVFKIKLPMTKNTLKLAYKRMAKIAHADGGGSDEAFRELKNLYDLAVTFEDIFIEEIKGDSLILINGKPLSTFGHGLDNVTNGITCDRCEGKGYETRITTIFEAAYYSSYKITPICKSCRGDGKHHTIEGKTVECMTCDGTGAKGVKKQTSYIECMTCEGVGEIALANPVFQKGAMV